MVQSNLKFVVAVLFCVTALAAVPAPAQQCDRPGFKAPALFTRLPNYWGDWVEEKQFDAHNFRVSKEKEERVEGHLFVYMYRFDNSRGGAPAS